MEKVTQHLQADDESGNEKINCIHSKNSKEAQIFMIFFFFFFSFNIKFHLLNVFFLNHVSHMI